MEPLIVFRRAFIWLCVYPPDDGTSKWKKRTYILFQISLLALNLFAVSMHIRTTLLIGTDDILHSTFSFVLVIGASNAVFNQLAMLCYRKEITEVLDSLSAVYDACEYFPLL